MTVQYRWPLGMPLVRNLGSALWEIRSALPNRIARTLFFVHEEEIVLLHGFIKKTRKTPTEDSIGSAAKKCVPQNQLRLETNTTAAASRISSGKTECSRKFKPQRSSERWP